MPLSIIPSHSVPVGQQQAIVVDEQDASVITPQLVDTSAKGIPTTANAQTSNPVYPILLEDQVTVQSGGEQVFRSDAFRNNTGRPIEFHAMRVNIILGTDPAGVAATGRVVGGGVVALEIEIDGVRMTAGAVPVWSICRSDNRTNELFTGTALAAATTGYCWYFSNPVLLRAGASVKVQAKHLGVVTQPAAVAISFSGRVCPKPIPKRIPYVAAWASRAFQYAEVGTDSAPPSAIVNDTERDLVVDRIIGRAIAYDDSLLGAGAANVELSDFGVVGGVLQGIYFLARLNVSGNRPILKTYTPWRPVFGVNAAIEENFVLRPGDYLGVDVAHVAGGAFGAGAFTYSQNRAMISVVGWREV